MNYINFKFLTLITAGLVILTSCKDDDNGEPSDPPPPSVSHNYERDSIYLEEGQSVDFELSVTPPVGLNALTIAGLDPEGDTLFVVVDTNFATLKGGANNYEFEVEMKSAYGLDVGDYIRLDIVSVDNVNNTHEYHIYFFKTSEMRSIWEHQPEWDQDFFRIYTRGYFEKAEELTTDHDIYFAFSLNGRFSDGFYLVTIAPGGNIPRAADMVDTNAVEKTNLIASPHPENNTSFVPFDETDFDVESITSTEALHFFLNNEGRETREIQNPEVGTTVLMRLRGDNRAGRVVPFIITGEGEDNPCIGAYPECRYWLFDVKY